MKPFHIRTSSSPVTMKWREIKAKVHVLHLVSPCAGGSLSSSARFWVGRMFVELQFCLCCSCLCWAFPEQQNTQGVGIETYRKQFILGNWFVHFRGLVILNLQDRLQGRDSGRCRIKLDMEAPAGASFVARSQSFYESCRLIRYLLTGTAL